MNAQQITKFLRLIPQSNQPAVPIAQLAPNEGTDILYGYALMLERIGIVDIDDKRRIKASSQTAKYTLESLASYTENDLRWIDDWKTRGVHRDENDLLHNGATLLHVLDARRMAMLDHPTPSRTEEVGQVIIKRTNPTHNVPEFLMQYDANADQYQFIGGRRSPSDSTLEHTIVREIEEEVRSDIQFKRDYHLRLVVPDIVVNSLLSPTFGALTEYHFSVFHMIGLKQQLVLHPEDAWVPVEQVLNGNVRINGRTTTATDTALYVRMDEAIDGGLTNLEDSFSI